MQLLFLCQREICHNLNGHPVLLFKFSLVEEGETVAGVKKGAPFNEIKYSIFLSQIRSIAVFTFQELYSCLKQVVSHCPIHGGYVAYLAITGCLICSRTGAGLTLIWVFYWPIPDCFCQIPTTSEHLKHLGRICRQ